MTLLPQVIFGKGHAFVIPPVAWPPLGLASTETIYNDMTLATIDLLAAIVTVFAASFGRLHGLRIDGSRTGSLFTSGSPTDMAAQGID
jgi:hypothetical protein